MLIRLTQPEDFMTEEKPKMSMSFEVRARRIDAHGGAWHYVVWNTSPQGSPAA